MSKDREKKSSRESLLKRWQRIKPGYRVSIIVAFITLAGSLAAGVCAVIASITPTIMTGDFPKHRNELKIASFRVNEWQQGALFGVPNGSLPLLLEANKAWEEQRNIIYSTGFHILYVDGDFNQLENQLPSGDIVPKSTLKPEAPYPSVPVEYELWNISRSDPAVIDEITIQVQEYEHLNTIEPDLYYLAKTYLGGGGNIPVREFDVSLSRSSTEVSLLRRASIRIRIDPGEPLVLKLSISFQDPGRYNLSVTIKYHYPNGSPATIGTPSLIYSWLGLDFVDGNDVAILE